MMSSALRMPASSAPAGGLSRLLDPRSIAIVGATPNFNRIGGIPIAALLAHGFPREKLILINPKYPEIDGIKCWPNARDLPFVPDLAVLAVRADEVVPTLTDLHEQGVTSAVVFAAGFGEEDTPAAKQLQAGLDAFIKSSGMKIAGPNTIGTANVRDRTTAAFIPTFGEQVPQGPVALIGQSGNTIAMMLVAARDAGLGISYFVSTGNEAAVEFAEYLEHFLTDPGTGATLGYIEQLRDGPRFVQAAADLRIAGKALFLMKSGQSEKAREATASHTGAMAGNAQVYKAAFRQLGIGIGADPTEVLQLGHLWSLKREVRSKRLSIVSISGAGCAFLSDLLSERGVEIPTFSDDTQSRLRKVIPAYGMVTNPIDLTGNVMNDLEHLRTVVDVLIAEASVDTIIFYVMGSLLDNAADILIDAAGRTGKLLVAIDPAKAARIADLQKAGVFVFNDVLRAVSSLSGFLDWSQRQAAPAWDHKARPTNRFGNTSTLMARVRASGRLDLNEVEAKQLLSAARISPVREAKAATADEAAKAASAIGYPVAVKVLSPDIAHKTEVGGVALGIADEEAAREAFTRVVESARKARPHALIEGVVVQEQINDGVPIILGVTNDPTFGPIMTVGLGGTATELFRDVSLRLLPVDRPMAREMLTELQSAPLLNGFRGAPLADLDTLADAMAGLSDMALATEGEWSEIEVNPVLVRPAGQGLAAVDALVRLSRNGA